MPDPTLVPMNASKRKNKPLQVFYPFLLFISLFFSLTVKGQSQRPPVRILFYNTENLFDVKDDPGTDDREFLPGGIRGWSSRRMNDKMIKLSKVILSAGNPEPPGIVGLCEVENRFVLDYLLRNTPLSQKKYRIIHKDSPDARGIEVALLYSESQIRPVKYDYFPVTDPKIPGWTTREILYFSCVLNGIDTLHLFINHWPSRSAGILETAEKRALAAKTLARQIESLQKRFYHPLILIMGDFNDQPSDNSLLKVLGAGKYNGNPEAKALYNLSSGWVDLPFGTHKFQSQWSVFDQVIVSGAFLSQERNIYCRPANARIYNPDFLFQNDKTYGGKKPFRTYSGYKYAGGFSDHLPVYLDIQLK